MAQRRNVNENKKGKQLEETAEQTEPEEMLASDVSVLLPQNNELWAGWRGPKTGPEQRLSQGGWRRRRRMSTTRPGAGARGGQNIRAGAAPSALAAFRLAEGFCTRAVGGGGGGGGEMRGGASCAGDASEREDQLGADPSAGGPPSLSGCLGARSHSMRQQTGWVQLRFYGLVVHRLWQAGGTALLGAGLRTPADGLLAFEVDLLVGGAWLRCTGRDGLAVGGVRVPVERFWVLQPMRQASLSKTSRNPCHLLNDVSLNSPPQRFSLRGQAEEAMFRTAFNKNNSPSPISAEEHRGLLCGISKLSAFSR
ncbi:unnamed protein product [Lota lota]